jgi:hypothetical protein
MNRLKNVAIVEVNQMKIEQPPIIPNRELALHNRKTIAEIKEMEGNSEVKVLINYNYLMHL